MAVSNVSNVGTELAQPVVAAAATAANNATVDYDSFLQLLVAQLKYQDPSEPTDSAQLMSQLASFSSVEQQIQSNDKLDLLIQGNLLSQANTLIGKTVTTLDGEQSGVAVSVIVANNSLEAVLKDGTKIKIENGVQISDTST